MTDEYRNEVGGALVSGGILEKGIMHPWKENRRLDESRVQVINFTTNSYEGTVDVAGPFNQARDLSNYFSDSLQQPNRSNKRLIVIEGLEPRILEVIGVKFRVPPVFFLGHCDERIEVNIVDRAYAKTSSVYWRVTVPQVRSINTERLEGIFGPNCYDSWCIRVGNVDRWAWPVTRGHVVVAFQNLVSYWSIEYPGDEGGWTAVVLVDPRHTRLRRDDLTGYTPEFPALFDLEERNAELELFSETTIWHEVGPSRSLGLDGPSWRIPAVHRNHRSALFDEIVEYFNDSGFFRPTYSSPLSAIEHIGSFLRPAWEEYWRDFESMLLRLTTVRSESLGLASAEMKVREYRDLMAQVSNIKMSWQRVLGIMRAFNYDGHLYHRHRPELMRDTEDQGAQFASDALKTEARNWARLKDKVERTEQGIRDHMEMYSQLAVLVQTVQAAKQTEEANALTAQGLEQANAANRMARSSSQLTKIATVIVPCSFVASVFSMGGEFAAGQSLFFVYWVISMPVTLTLLLLVIYGNQVTDAWKHSKEKNSEPGRRAPKWAVWRDFVSTLWTARSSPQVLGHGAQDEWSSQEKTDSLEA